MLNQFLLDQLVQGNDVVLLIDEAQDLDFELLEQVRLLSNLETDQRKLLQIVLLGQPELREKLDENAPAPAPRSGSPSATTCGRCRARDGALHPAPPARGGRQRPAGLQPLGAARDLPLLGRRARAWSTRSATRRCCAAT